MNLQKLTVGLLPGGDLVLGLPNGVRHSFQTGKPVNNGGALEPMNDDIANRIRSQGLHPHTVIAMLAPKNAEALGI